MNNLEKQKKHFESISEKFYKARQTENHLTLKDLMWTYFFKNKDYLRKDNMVILEPMCGYAEAKTILEKKLGICVNYEGFDYSNVLVELVKSKNPDFNIYEMDITKFQSKKMYDLIVLISGLHHVPNFAQESVSNLSKYLKEDGYFINIEPTNNNLLFKKVRELIYKNNDIFDESTEKAFELNELNNIFLSAGFKPVDQIYPGLLSFILYYNPDVFPYLNIGNKSLVKFIFNLDKLFFRNFIGRKLSFATLTLWQK